MSEQQLELIQTPDYHQIKQNFLNELILASQGKPSSLSFIRHHLPQKPLLKKGIIQGIVIGGTNYIFSTEKMYADGSREVLKKETGVLPALATKKIFVDFLIEHLDSRADAIGMNFGFKMEQVPTTDGTLDGLIVARGTKDHTFTGITESVGSLVKLIFLKKYQKHVIASIANDTVCLLLSGNDKENGSIIAGTGFNMGLLRRDTQSIAINLEAGGFNKFALSPILKQIDARTKNPGKKLFEKTISGKYLALYFNEKVKELKLPIPPIATSQELSELSHERHTDVAGDLARAIITRSAYLVAAAIAGIYAFYDEPKTFPLIGEGSLLWDGWQYHENIKRKLTELGVPQEAISIKHIKGSSLKGAFGLIN